MVSSIAPWQRQNFTTALQKGDETLLSTVFAILGDSGGVSWGGGRGGGGGEEKSKLWEKKSTNQSQERKEKPLVKESCHTSSKKRSECCLLIKQKKFLVFPLYYSEQSANSNFRDTFLCSYTTVVVSAILAF